MHISSYAPSAPYAEYSQQTAHPINLGFLSYQTVSNWLKKSFTSYTTFTLRKANPDSTVFAFDLHDVMVTPNLSQTLRLMAHMPHKLKLLFQFFNPWFVYDFIHLYRNNTFEDLVLQLSEKYQSFAQSQEALFAIANAQRPLWGTIKIINELKQHGFKIYLLSNIGQTMFDKFKEEYPDIFESFDDFFVSTPEYDYIHKPDLRMFDLFLKQYSLEAHNVVFVDDKIANIQAANKIGMQGILFSTPENLRKELEKIGALYTKPPVYHDELLSISYLFVQHPNLPLFS